MAESPGNLSKYYCLYDWSQLALAGGDLHRYGKSKSILLLQFYSQGSLEA